MSHWRPFFAAFACVQFSLALSPKQVKGNTIFDNVIITDEVAEADKCLGSAIIS